MSRLKSSKKRQKLAYLDVENKGSVQIEKALDTTSKRMLNEQRIIREGFQERLDYKWKKPLDLLECVIQGSQEIGIEMYGKLVKNNVLTTKNFAILRIHARALLISNEILSLLRTGYADGANARWRSLHELAVIVLFLSKNNDDVSKRYLDHSIMKSYKDAKEYQECCKKLDYPRISRKQMNTMKKECEYILNQYGDEFKYGQGYEWIPTSILSDRNFRTLEKHVKLDKMRSFYSQAANSLHGGAKGFFSLGLMTGREKRWLIGASNWGLADPLQNTAISLVHITNCLINLNPELDTVVLMPIFGEYVKKIGKTAVQVQKEIKKDEIKIAKLYKRSITSYQNQ